MTLKNWCQLNFIEIDAISSSIFVINEKVFLLKEPVKGKLFYNDYTFRFSQEERGILREYEVDFIMFNFGNRYYYSPFNDEDYFNNNKVPVVLKDLKFVGDSTSKAKVHLGVHSGYELLNGSGKMSDWVSKAKFLGVETLGICDKGTLAGSLPFQLATKQKGIKSVIGVTYDVVYYTKEDFDISYEVKLYVKNKLGWRNLLKLHKIYKIDNDDKLTLQDLNKYTEGLILVIPRFGMMNDSSMTKSETVRYINNHVEKFGSDNVYYQIDSVEYASAKLDNNYLKSLKRYFNEFSNMVPPILINDSYYIDQEQYRIKKYTNSIGKKNSPQSQDQFFKSSQESKDRLLPFFDFESTFSNGKNPKELFQAMFDNAIKLANDCNFEIDTGNHKLPKYEGVEDREELFWDLIKKGLNKKVKKDLHKEYIERIGVEANVIVPAGFIDYFLILWDVINFCDQKGIEYGIGRGSAGGCLIAYLLGITNIDPVEWGLMFERFLNEARVKGGSLPDIDIDFETERRDEVKQYFIEKYSYEQVVYVGTFTTMKLKGGLKDVGRIAGFEFNQINYINNLLPDQVKYSWDDIFIAAQQKPQLYNFVQNNSELIIDIKHIMNQPKAQSIHASALVVTPKYDNEGNRMKVWDWLPCRKTWDEKNGKWILISEYEGEYMEKAGFLKEDILGLKLLGEFKNMKKLIKKFYDQDLNLLEIELDQPETMELFAEGNTEGIFQFHSSGMKSYSKIVQPESLSNLIAMNALFRPGPMRSHAHTDFADIKHGRKQPRFDYLLESVTEDTNGLYIYQEQIMKAFVKVGFTPVESDQIRRLISKVKVKEMLVYKKEFVKRLGKMYKGFYGDDAKKEATKIWDKLVRFSAYGFNKSHSAAYAMMGYWSQYLKANYPLVFWTTVLEYSNDDFVTTCYLSEKEKRFPEIKVLPPDVNRSGLKFIADPDKNTIYWSLIKIKQIGFKTVFKIIKERDKNGRFKSLDDFAKRVGDKGVMESLILSGSFDSLYGITEDNLLDRRFLLKYMYEITNHKRNWPRSEYDSHSALNDNHYWSIKQQQVSQLGWIDFKELIARKKPRLAKLFKSGKELDSIISKRKVTVAGMIQGYNKKTSKKGNVYAKLNLRSNSFFISIFVWSGAIEKYEEEIKKAKKGKMLIALTCNSEYREEDDTTSYFMGEEERLFIL